MAIERRMGAMQSVGVGISRGVDLARSAPPALRTGLATVLFLAFVMVTWWVTLIPEDPGLSSAAQAALDGPDLGLITTWPAGILAGVAPTVVGAEVDPEGCVELVEGGAIDMVPHTEVSAIWVYADDRAEVRIDWTTTALDQATLVPQEYLAHPTQPGRVTVTLAPSTPDAVVTISALRGATTICGLQAAPVG